MSLSRDWLRSAGRVAAVTTLAAAALSLFAGSASAHVPSYGVNCDRETGVLTVWIQADSYQDSEQVVNRAVVKDGDKTLLNTTFKSALERKTWELDGTVDHKLTFDVDIEPDPNKPKWELHEVENVKACKTETTKPTTTTTTTVAPTTVSTTPSSTAPTTASTVISPTTTVAPNPNDLPDTGSNVGLPLAIGGLLVLGGGGALLVARRKRSN
ncbi:LPXTG-motif cell wall-anchored protein [Actinokineospora baliensis]|uniref:LPXTG cell wall anchor domain-containing protein n=1 Tax=Actinokineospora baliensis TaxID=547056 RepID=UPI001959684D|nr:LPXTG cell wall anchor domain-containing protein [Actinokineospora baliensis]MBM7769911.1 LPXTG-motif cell wall-anchored protein [Actinokineospora baliensis]